MATCITTYTAKIVNLTMSEEEAQFLYALLGATRGGYHNFNDIAFKLYNALNAGAFECMNNPKILVNANTNNSLSIELNNLKYA